VRELLAAHRREVTEIWLTEGNDPSPILGEIDRLAREAHVPVRLVSPRRLESVQGTDTPQGVVAFAEPLTAVTLDELVLGPSGVSGRPVSAGSVDDFDDFDDVDDELEDEDFDIFIDVEDFEPVEQDESGDDAPEAEVDSTVADDVDAEVAVVGTTSEELVGEAPAESHEDAAGHEDAAEREDAAGHEDAAEREDAAGINPAAVEAVEAIERAGWVAEGVRQSAKAAPAAPVEHITDTAFLVVLEGVTDPQNLGAILRTAECAGATGVAVPRHRSVHVTPAVTKAAAGAIEHLPMALVAGVPSALQELERLGVMTVGLDERGTSSLFDLDLGDRPVALVLGSEGTGLSSLSRRRCDVLCRIPLAGEIPSLNVSAAAAVACFEVARQRGGAASK